MPTYTKVTEVVGKFQIVNNVDFIEAGPDGSNPVYLAESMPDFALTGEKGWCPRGRFRITVEFTPEEG